MIYILYIILYNIYNNMYIYINNNNNNQTIVIIIINKNKNKHHQSICIYIYKSIINIVTYFATNNSNNPLFRKVLLSWRFWWLLGDK